MILTLAKFAVPVHPMVIEVGERRLEESFVIRTSADIAKLWAYEVESWDMREGHAKTFRSMLNSRFNKVNSIWNRGQARAAIAIDNNDWAGVADAVADFSNADVDFRFYVPSNHCEHSGIDSYGEYAISITSMCGQHI